MSIGLILLACGTAFDVVVDVLYKTWPPKLRGNKLAGLKITRVSSSFVIMISREDGVMKRILRGYIDMTFISQDMVVIFPVRKVGLEGNRDVLERGLQVLEDKRVRF